MFIMKYPHYLLLIIALFTWDKYVDAQTYFIGVTGGLSIPNLTAESGGQTPLNTGYSSRLGPEVGIFADFKISKAFSLQPMVQYSSQGGQKNGMQALTSPDAIAQLFPAGQAPKYLYANYKSEAKLSYLMIPVLAKYSWNIAKSPFSIYAEAGPFIAFLLSAKQVTSGSGNLYMDASGYQPLPVEQQSFDNTEDIKKQLYNVNFGIEGYLGFNYQMARNNVFVQGGGNYGLLNIQKNPDNGKSHVGAGVVVLGYSRQFGK